MTSSIGCVSVDRMSCSSLLNCGVQWHMYTLTSITLKGCLAAKAYMLIL